MLRRLADFTRRLFSAIWHAFRDLGNILMLPFRSGSPVKAMRALIQEIGHFFRNLVRGLDPRQLPTVIARDSQTLVKGGQTLAFQTTATATGFGSMILWSPVTIGRWLFTLPGRFWHFLRTRSKLQLLSVTLFVVIGLTAFGWPLITIFKERGRDLLRKEQERQLDLHFTRGMIDGVKHNLSAIKGIYPNDVAVANRLAALEAGESGPNDFRMARLLMHNHYAHNRLTDAAREARKYLDSNSSDWESLVMLADIAWRQGNRKLASEYVQRMKNPKDVPPWACLAGARLMREFGATDQLSALLDFVCENYLPHVRNNILATSEPAFKLQLIELYNLALTQIGERPKLKSHWVPVQEVCHNIANTEDISSAALTKLAHCQEIHLENCLRRFHELQLITLEEYRQFGREIEERLTVIWSRLRAKEPTNPLAYMGLAMQQARARNLHAALGLIDEGIAKCGKSADLVEKKADILRLTDPAASLTFLESEQGDQPPTLNMCRSIALAALAAQRPDRAIAILEKAHAIRPNLPWVCQLEAQALMQAGRPTDAAATLRRVLPQISTDPAGVVAYIQALAASGAVSSAEAFLQETLKADPNSPAAAVGADALARLGYLESAVNSLRLVIRQQHDNNFAHVLLGDCLRQVAEKKPGGWDQEMVREAISNYRTALDHYPKNAQLINNIAWLQLVALNLKREALETVHPIRELPDLPSAMLETVGAVLVANGSYDAGRTALERSIQLGGERATTLAFLADAYRGLNRSTDSLLALRKALAAPKTNPRDADIIKDIRHRIERSSP